MQRKKNDPKTMFVSRPKLWWNQIRSWSHRSCQSVICSFRDLIQLYWTNCINRFWVMQMSKCFLSTCQICNASRSNMLVKTWKIGFKKERLRFIHAPRVKYLLMVEFGSKTFTWVTWINLGYLFLNPMISFRFVLHMWCALYVFACYIIL